MDSDHIGRSIAQAGSGDSTNVPSMRHDRDDRAGRPRKQLRTSRACDFCHNRSIGCRKSPGASRCNNCNDFDVACSYDRPAKKRGNPNRRHDLRDMSSGQEANLLLQTTNGPFHGHQRLPLATRQHLSTGSEANTENVLSFPLATAHRELALGEAGMIADLVDVYLEVVYPIFPLFHRHTLLKNVARRKYLFDPAAFSVVMSICALASARARDGAGFPGRWHASHFIRARPETFFSAAIDTIPRELSAMRGLDWMRTCAILALYGIQIGKIDIMHQYLGIYHSQVALDGLHNEMNWPKQIGIVEVEERRRLFWSIYTLDVYSSIVWSGVIRYRESQSRVSYPSEVDDDLFSDDGFSEIVLRSSTKCQSQSTNQQIVSTSSWLHGWNFTTELYRILEHAMDRFHRRRPHQVGPFTPSKLFTHDTPSQSSILENVMSMYNELPPKLKDTSPIVSHMGEVIFGFQAANITATLQLVRMVLFTADDATVDQKCSIARELLSSLSQVPVLFLRAISSPLLYHIVGIGSILGSVMEEPLSESSYHEVRKVLLCMADLLGNLETGISRAVGATGSLRSQITRMDEFMLLQRQLEQPHGTNQYASGKRDKSLGMLPPGSVDTATDMPTQWQPQSVVPCQYANGLTGTDNDADQILFQLPPELLEGLPWNFDFLQTFSL